MDVKSLTPGQDWELEVGKAIRRSHFFVACLSTRAVTKQGFIQKELRRAFDIYEELPEGTIYLVPVRLEPATFHQSCSDCIIATSSYLLRSTLYEKRCSRGLSKGIFSTSFKPSLPSPEVAEVAGRSNIIAPSVARARARSIASSLDQGQFISVMNA
jgi:hypothetical protein